MAGPTPTPGFFLKRGSWWRGGWGFHPQWRQLLFVHGTGQVLGCDTGGQGWGEPLAGPAVFRPVRREGGPPVPSPAPGSRMGTQEPKPPWAPRHNQPALCGPLANPRCSSSQAQPRGLFLACTTPNRAELRLHPHLPPTPRAELWPGAYNCPCPTPAALCSPRQPCPAEGLVTWPWPEGWCPCAHPTLPGFLLLHTVTAPPPNQTSP